MTMFRHATRLLAALALAGLAACGSGEPGETRVAIIATDEDAQQAFLDGATAQGLVAFDARGNVQPALAESWHVSDDGRSYIFRLARGRWDDGEAIRAQAVAEALREAVASRPHHDALGGIDEIVAMTDRVIEIRLKQARPHLLQLLAQPALAVRIDGKGAGPFAIGEAGDEDTDANSVHFMRETRDQYDELVGTERVHVDFKNARAAIASFVAGEVELVLGGSFASLPLVRDAGVSRTALRYDPVAGLFGLLPTGSGAIANDPQARRLLSRAIDRAAFIDSLGVPALTPRTTLLQEGIDLPRPPIAPAWTRDGEAATDDNPGSWQDAEASVVGVSLPEGPGSALLLDRLRDDWGRLGIDVQSVEPGAADFILVDEVAPSSSAAWFPRRIACAHADICDPEIDALVEAARIAPVVAQRHAILLDAGARIDASALFIPITAPIRWSLVAPAITGFAENRFARHPLIGLKRPLSPEIAR